MKMSKSESGRMGGIKSIEITKLKKEQRIDSYNTNPKKCKHCSSIFPYEKRRLSFCNSSCSASFNNTKREKTITVSLCLNCNIEIKSKTYCSITCQKEHQYKNLVSDWLHGVKNPCKAVIKKYLSKHFGYKCVECGIDSYNGKPIVLEIEHKDGNSYNNNVDNLCFLCPNCHSQTTTYKGKNKGNGRHYRRVRYSEGKSY